MQSKVSVRGQTVIPREIRKLLGITPNSFLSWEVADGVITVHPVPADPVHASLGLLKGRGSLDEFLGERGEDRARERRGEG
jgi:AbrB family looped-hinge helix DNA binding protein